MKDQMKLRLKPTEVNYDNHRRANWNLGTVCEKQRDAAPPGHQNLCYGPGNKLSVQNCSNKPANARTHTMFDPGQESCQAPAV